MINKLFVALMFFCSLLSYSQTYISGTLAHTRGYFLMKPYNHSYDDGSYFKAFYDGNNKQLRFWNSDVNTMFTRLKMGGLSIASSNPVSSTNGFENRIEFLDGGHAAIVFHPGKPDELMFGMHTNGHYYWGRGKSHAQNPSDYSMYLDGVSGDLGIKGKLTSSEVKVQIGGWADYVFKEDYKLPTLEEVEKSIKQKGHLINIPSAKEVKKNGIELGEMNRLLLEKIEELTLYILEQDKSIEEQSKDNKTLLAKVNKLEQLLNEFILNKKN